MKAISTYRHIDGQATQFVCYMPYGETLVDEHTTAPDPAYLTAYKFNGKEMDAETGLYYYGTRYYEPELAMWYGVDALAELAPNNSPYVFCSDNPLARIDIDGNWDIEVHSYSNRAQGGYAVMIVKDIQGKEVYRTVVRVEGAGGRQRDGNNCDTPQGKYKILEWRKTGNKRYNRVSFGPNSLLALDYQEGEGGGRNGIHVHGGRQEDKYKDRKDLAKTHGCMRINDQDISDLKSITDELEKNNPNEKKGFLTVTDDLKEPVLYDEKRHQAGLDQFPKERKKIKIPKLNFINYEQKVDKTYVARPTFSE